MDRIRQPQVDCFRALAQRVVHQPDDDVSGNLARPEGQCAGRQRVVHTPARRRPPGYRVVHRDRIRRRRAEHDRQQNRTLVLIDHDDGRTEGDHWRPPLPADTDEVLSAPRRGAHADYVGRCSQHQVRQQGIPAIWRAVIVTRQQGPVHLQQVHGGLEVVGKLVGAATRCPRLHGQRVARNRTEGQVVHVGPRERIGRGQHCGQPIGTRTAAIRIGHHVVVARVSKRAERDARVQVRAVIVVVRQERPVPVIQPKVRVG